MNTAEPDPLIAALCRPGLLGPDDSPVEVLETHISWVLLAGDCAYKIKKPLNLGFLDFSTLEKRHQACLDELRLNRRLAPEIYLAVVPITGNRQNPSLEGAGEVLEYAVKMRRFSQDRLLGKLLEEHQLSPEHLDNLIDTVARFHQSLPPAPPSSAWGTASAIWEPAEQNFHQVKTSPLMPEYEQILDLIQRWSQTEHDAKRNAFAARRAEGFIRECHGDLHLGNMVADDGGVTPFDCIEFNPALRWIDTMSELAFLVMDLTDRGAPRYAARALNGYLEHTGDYAGLSVLRYYLVYRAMVRAKVNAIRCQQEQLAGVPYDEAKREAANYLALATRYTQPPKPFIVITHGLSGCGKTTYAQSLLEKTEAVRVRSDIERKRLAGLAAQTNSRSTIDSGLYSADSTEQTYHHLLTLSRQIVTAGWPVIVDATFLLKSQRAAFVALGSALNLPVLILAFEAQPTTLERRVLQRSREGRDASEATLEVLNRQRQHIQPLSAVEHSLTLRVDTEKQTTEDAWIDECILRLGGGLS